MLLIQDYISAGGFEKDVITAGATRYIQYISSPVGLVAIVESQGSSHTVHYTYTDHLGSIVTVTNGSATVEHNKVSMPGAEEGFLIPGHYLPRQKRCPIFRFGCTGVIQVMNIWISSD